MQHVPGLEEQILGGMMRYDSALATGLSVLCPEHFQAKAHRAIFEAMAALHQSGLPVDAVMIAQHLGVAGVMGQVGGYLRLAEILDSACAERDSPRLMSLLCDAAGDNP